MNYPSTDVMPLADIALVNYITTGYSWVLDSTRTLYWSFADGFQGQSWNDPQYVYEMLSDVFETIEYYVDVDFEYVGYFDTPETAYYYGSNLTVSLGETGYEFSSSSTWARGYFPSYDFSESLAGDVFLNVSSRANFLSFEPGAEGWFLLFHEIGHALGLKHPHDDGGTGRPTFEEGGITVLDSDVFTVMSYLDDYDWNEVSWNPASYMLMDVIGLQYLYGENQNVDVGDTIHKLYDTNLYFTLWDAGGKDTLDLSFNQEGWEVCLIPKDESGRSGSGYATPIYDLYNMESPGTLYWLLGDYENCIGTNQGDRFYGNELDNVFHGLSGEDLMFGGAGDDTLFGEGWNDTIFGDDGNDNIVGGWGYNEIDGGNGIDTLFVFEPIEMCQFYTNDHGLTWQVNTLTFIYSEQNTLTNVERLDFENAHIALDLNADAGFVAKILGVTFGADAVHNNDYVGIGLYYLDSGMSYEDLASLAITASGANTSDAVVTTLWQNLFGAAPTIEEKTPYVELIDNSYFSLGELTILAAEQEINQINIDLLGLVETGLEYTYTQL